MRINMTFIFFVTLMLIGVLVGQALYKVDFDNNEKRDIYNYTENVLDWDKLINRSVNQSIDLDSEEIVDNRINKILYKFIDFFGTLCMEFIKFFVELGYNNPSFDTSNWMSLIKYYIIAVIIIAIIPLIIPIIAIIYLLFEGIRHLVNKWKIK